MTVTVSVLADPRACFFEDFHVGQTFVTGRREITEEDLCMCILWDGEGPAHTDVEWCKKTIFGQRLIHGDGTLALSKGLVSQLGVFSGTLWGWLRARVKYVKPVFIADTLNVGLTVQDKKETDDPAWGIVDFLQLTFNQRAEVVCQVAFSAKIARKG